MAFNRETAMAALRHKAQGNSTADVAKILNLDPDHVRALVSMAYTFQIQAMLSVDQDGWIGPQTMRALHLALDQSAPTLRDGSSQEHRIDLSFGARIVDWLCLEAANWKTTPVPESRVAQYLECCERDGAPGFGEWLSTHELKTNPGVRDTAFCAAARGFAEQKVALPGEALPPPRAGALELMQDAIAGKRPGETWAPVSDVIAGKVLPSAGDVAVYRNTIRTGAGHIRTVVDSTPLGYRGVAANENGGRWASDVLPRSYLSESRASTDGHQRLVLEGFSIRGDS
jgi:hypothetical protein